MALLPFVASLPSGQAPGYGYAPAPYAPAPYGPPAYGHGYGGYGYETPKHNCSVLDVIETAEVCTPVIENRKVLCGWYNFTRPRLAIRRTSLDIIGQCVDQSYVVGSQVFLHYIENITYFYII